MAVVLQAHSLNHSAGRRPLYAGLDVVINAQDRLALVGYNGCGKSTLLRILAGELEPDGGHVRRSRNLRLACVEQFLPDDLLSLTLREALAREVPAEEAWKADAQLSVLGFDEAQLTQSLSSLSGGQLNRLMLGRALIREPQLLLLDEPTNHLDLATLALFETVLAEFAGALLIVSHDRAFLDAVCKTTLVMRDQRLYRFDLPYSDARSEMARMDAAAAARRSAEEKKIAQVRAGAKRLAEWGDVYDNENLARRAKSMFKRVEKMEEARTFVSKGSPLDLELSAAGSKGNRMLTLDGLDVSVAGRQLFTSGELFFGPGERVALLGHNGVGKTTLIKLILEQIALTSGSGASNVLRVSPQVRLGYYDQELQAVAGDDSLFDFVARDIKRDDQGVVGALVAAGFAFEMHRTPVRTLSGGERARALFARLSLLRPNFLILDEPTNHIDIEGREQLEAQLLESDAAVLFTSHDREFVRTIAQRFWVIEDGRLQEHTQPDDFFQRAAQVGGGSAIREPASPAIEPERDKPVGEALRDEAFEDELLERIERLETLLAEDEARKAKFQKPMRQAQWREELAELTLKLDSL